MDTKNYNASLGATYYNTDNLSDTIGINFGITPTNAGIILTNNKTEYIGYDAKVLKEAELRTDDNTYLFETIVPTIKIDPINNETNIILGVVNDDKIVSISVINFSPGEKTVKLVPIPDKTLLYDVVLQDLYNRNDTRNLQESIQNLIGTEVNRYLFISTDGIERFTNQMLAQESTQLLCQILYKFSYNGAEYSSYSTVDSGEVSKAMFLESSYGTAENVSFSDIGIKFLQALFNAYAKPSSAEKLVNVLSSSELKNYLNTNLTKKEIVAYGDLLANCNKYSLTVINISGKNSSTSSSSYFVPDNINSDKNIFK
jgi:hypothetical protein